MADNAVLFVTRSGHSRELAEMAGRQFSARVFEIGDLENRKGILGFIRSGYQSVSRKATPISDPRADLSGAKIVVLIQPVWASQVVPPMRSWLNAHHQELKGKKIVLICSNQGSPAERIRANFEKEFGRLDGFTVVNQKLPRDARARLIDAVAQPLKEI